MKDKKVLKRYPTKMYVVKLQPKNAPYSFLANYSFYRSKRAADAYADVRRFPASDNIVKKFTMKASKGKELILFLRNVANAVLIAQSHNNNPLASLRKDVFWLDVHMATNKKTKEV